jgi:hypothetical protein
MSREEVMSERSIKLTELYMKYGACLFYCIGAFPASFNVHILFYLHS